ncbi:hypothetical protein MVEN_00290300 [Mycena venus]|uniref:Uncharacterized protein n=1 Tax=Mycena venus TaxID=2733690 RepID=A0A8H7DFJ7_9AGAR|nr:hypothetical protein MVEN_00290300 [Mycena venus]
MSGEGNEPNTFNYQISGGTGGVGGEGGVNGGGGGTGEGPTVIFDHSTNKIVHLGQGLKEVLCKWNFWYRKERTKFNSY